MIKGFVEYDIHIAMISAKHVMEWTHRPSPLDSGDYWCIGGAVSGKVYRRFGARCTPPKNGGVRSATRWSPLTSDADAFILVRALLAKGHQFRLYGPFSSPDSQLDAPNWVAVIYDHAAGSPSSLGSDRELSKAVTIACLRAVGVEINQ